LFEVSQEKKDNLFELLTKLQLFLKKKKTKLQLVFFLLKSNSN